MKLTLNAVELSEDRWRATVQELPGVVAEGRTRAEALQQAQEMARALVFDQVYQGELPEEELRGLFGEDA